MSAYLGIDIGGTNVVFGVVDDQYGIKYKNQFKTKSFNQAQDLANTIFKDLKENCKFKIVGIGIGAPSVNCFTQKIEYAPNLNKWGEIIDLVPIFEKLFEVPVRLMNDANAAAVGEKYFGDAKDNAHFAVVTLGTGVGMGLYINNKLYIGDHAMAGEIGHVVIRQDGRACNCGNYGCIETYIGKEGIVSTAREKLEFSSGSSILSDISPSDLTPQEIFNAAKKEDPVALDIVDTVAKDLGYSLSLVMNLFDFDKIYLTGGVAKSGNVLKKRVEKYLKIYTLPSLQDKVQIKISELNDSDGAVKGAVAAYLETH